MGIAHNRSLGDLRVCHQRAFHFCGAHAVTGDVDDVIDAARDPVVTIGVTAAAVTGEVVAFVVAEIGLHEAFMIAPNGTHLTRPAVFEAQNAFAFSVVDFFARVRVQNNGLNAEERLGCRAGLEGRGAGQGGQQVTAGLSLPPRVNDGAFPFADHVIVPVPGFGVDRLTDGAQHLERRQIAFLNKLVTLTHQRANGGGSGVELVHLVLFADLPEAAGIGVGRHAFEHDRGRAIGQRAVDDVAVAGDPTHVSGAPEDVAIMVVKDVFHGHRGIGEIPA